MSLKRFLCAALLLAISLSCCGCSFGKKVEVTFQPNNGDPVVTVQVNQGSLIQDAPTPEKRTCDFVGWYHGDTAWDLATMKVEEPVTLTAKWTLRDDAFQLDPNAGVRAEGTDIRVCTFNVLTPSAGAKKPTAGRDTAFANMAKAYQPDIIALQEFCTEWRLAFSKVFQDSNYELVNPFDHKIDGYSTNCTLAYNTDRLTMKWVHAYSYMVSDTKTARTIVWALFETKDESKQQFIALSTHWSTTQSDRTPEAEELATMISGMVKRYQVPVIVAGDLNAYEVSGNQFALSSYTDATCYDTLIKNASLSDAKYTAAKRGLVSESFHRGDGTGTRADLTSGFWKLGAISFRDYLVNTYVSIDHIFYTTGVKPLYYDTIIHEDILNASDHNPVYADFQFVSAS